MDLKAWKSRVFVPRRVRVKSRCVQDVLKVVRDSEGAQHTGPSSEKTKNYIAHTTRYKWLSASEVMV